MTTNLEWLRSLDPHELKRWFDSPHGEGDKRMTEIKQCPFCGGEAETLTAESMHGGYLFGIMCNDCRSRGDVYDTEAEAVAAWNARAERTCELIDNGTWGYPYGCSECGASFDADVNNGDFNYCPNCGAKVIV